MGHPVEVVVDSRVRVRADDVDAVTAAELRARFEHSNPEWHKRKALNLWRGADCPAVIKTWRDEQDGETGEWWLTLPRGGMGRLRALFKERGIDYVAIDRRTTGLDLGSYIGDWTSDRIFPRHTRIPWEHQARFVRAFDDVEQGLARSPTGSGKTSMLLMLIAELNLPSIIVMNRAKLLDQWAERVESELGVDRKQIGIVRGKTFRLRPITLAMQQTLWKLGPDEWETLAASFGLVGVDEAQGTAARTLLDSVDRFPARYRIGVSDDERRADRKEFLNYDMFGGIVFEVTREELEARGVVERVEALIVPTDFEADWYVDQKDGGEELPDFGRLLGQMVGDDRRNHLIADLAADQARQGPTLVFAHRIEHCRRLDALLTARGIRTGLMLGGVEQSAEFDRTKAGLGSGDIQCGIGTYGAIGVGQDIPTVVAGVCATPMHKNRQNVRQVVGRLCRRSDGKSGARMYFIWDPRVFGTQPLNNLNRWCNGAWVLVDDDAVPVDDYLREGSYEQSLRDDDEVVSADALLRGRR